MSRGLTYEEWHASVFNNHMRDYTDLRVFNDISVKSEVSKLPNLPACYPTPVGWQLLVRLKPEVAKTKGGIFIPEVAQQDSLHLAVCGEVVAMGPLCYSRDDMSKAGDWVKPGDWVMFEKYSGRRFKIDDNGTKYELRCLNDDEIQAIVSDPDGILPYMTV